MIKEHATWGIQDSTKIQSAINCPRQYFFEYVLGWRRKEPNIHLEFGSAVHLAMEHLLLHGYSAESIADAYTLFEEYYRNVFPPQDDGINTPKIPSNFLRALSMYVNQYKFADKFSVIDTEVAGTVLIDDGKLVYYKSDSILEDPDAGIFSLEHKTGSRLTSQWTNQWAQKIQVGMYCHVLYCQYDAKDVYGVKINGLFIKSPPVRKNSKDCEFVRVPIRKSLAQMEDWLWQTNYWYDRIVEGFDRLSGCKEGDPIMKAFPKSSENCTKYFGCPFIDYCHTWTNPLKHCSEPPIGFKVEFWDPRNMLTKAKKVITL